MSVVAPLSRYKKQNVFILIAICFIAGGWFAYDGYFSQKFIEEHKNEDGSADSTLEFNRKSPPYFAAAAVLLAGYFFYIKDRKVVAEVNELVINGKEKIPYDSIEKIDKTYFDSKGFFVISYKTADGAEKNLKFGDRTYDNLPAVLDALVAKIS